MENSYPLMWARLVEHCTSFAASSSSTKPPHVNFRHSSVLQLSSEFQLSYSDQENKKGEFVRTTWGGGPVKA